MKTYRVAIIGCGHRGTQAALAYQEHPRTEVVALCDLVSTLRDNLGDNIGVSARYEDLDKMILDTQPDIVAIPTGTELHHDLCMRVLEHGVNIEVEKPIAVNLSEADSIIAKANDHGVTVAVHHQGRLGSSAKAIECAYSQGRIGEVRYMVGSGKGYYGGYGLMNIGTHILNNIMKFGGHCRAVTAVSSTNGHPITPEDVVASPSGMGTIAGEYISASLMLENNVTATLLQHRFNEIAPTGHTFEIYGTEGRIFYQGHEAAWLLPNPHTRPGGKQDSWESLEPVFPAHYNENGRSDVNDYWFVEEYVQALDDKRDHECSGSEAIHALEIIMGIFESTVYSQTVKLPQSRRDHPLLRWRGANGLSSPDSMPRPYQEWLAMEDHRLKNRDPIETNRFALQY